MGEREHQNDLSLDPEMESRLRSARPQPDDDFLTRLESDLFAGGRAPRFKLRPAWRPTFAAGFAIAAIALLTLALDLAGIGPFGGPGHAPVEASDKCRTVLVSKRERVPVAHQIDGQDVIRFEYRNVKRHVKRCP
jgi:hypothetical protein